MPTNQQNNKSGSQGSNRQNENERDRKTMSDSDRSQQGKTGLGRDQDKHQPGPQRQHPQWRRSQPGSDPDLILVIRSNYLDQVCKGPCWALCLSGA